MLGELTGQSGSGFRVHPRRDHGRRQSPADQRPAQPFSGACEPRLDRADWQSKMACSFLMGHPLEVAQDDRSTVFFRQSSDLVLDLRHQLCRAGERGREAGDQGRIVLFQRRAPARLGPGPNRDPARDAEEPARDRFTILNGARFSSQDQECSLERILRGMGIVKDAEADPKHHGTVALYQGRESGVCGVLGSAQEPFEELAVRL